MRWPIVMAAAAVVAACSQKPQLPENQAGANEQVAEANIGGNAAATPSKNRSKGPGGEGRPGALPAANAALRFVGTWASSEAECASRAWRFTADELTVDDGPHCRFYKLMKAPGGYNIAATCPTKQPVHADLIKLRFAESARAMLVESNAIRPTGLVYCGK